MDTYSTNGFTQEKVKPKNAIESYIDLVKRKNPNEPEFIQAVEEVAHYVVPYVEGHEEYKSAKILERLAEPERVIMFRVPWIDDKGDFKINRGYRVQMNSAIGPYKGGLRFHPSVNLGILKFLAFEQVLKNSLTTLPMGGGKGGSDFDPKGKSDNEVMKFCQSFMTELNRHINEKADVPAGDIGVGSREIGYLFGQYKRIKKEFTGILTGKGLEYGGSLIRPEATGYGCVYFADNMMKKHGMSIKGKRCTVSGSGNVAQYTIEKLIDLGAKPVSCSDSSGSVHVPDGITKAQLEFLKELKNVKRGRVSEFAKEFGLEYYPNERPWSFACDMAFPSATQNELNLEDAEKLIGNGCLCVTEGANMPTTPDAMRAFHEANVLFAPGKASNAGGVATSGLEMSQNSIGLAWTREEVDAKLRNIMDRIHDQCVKYGETGNKVDYVKGANIAGFVKVADAMLAQGHV